jgi:hypothetical protein
MGRSLLRVISKECDPSLATDRSLPYTAYLIEYSQEGITKFDIVSSSKQVEIFDYYWDLYKKDFINMTQTEGRTNPRLWQDPNEPKKGKKK